MQHNKLACLPIHVWDRELDSRLLLALMLVRQGVTVLLGHEYNISPVYRKIDHIFHIGAGRPVYDPLRTEKWFKPIIQRQGFAGLIYEEGINDLATGSAFHFAGINKQAIDTTSKMYGWCSEELKLMKQQTNDTQEQNDLEMKFTKCLNTRIELLMPHFASNYYKESTNSLKTIFGNYVLLSDNFATEAYGTKKKHEHTNVQRLDMPNQNKDLLTDQFTQYMDKKYEARNNFCALVKALATSNPYINYIMRPHPTADNRFWHEEFAGFRNIIVLYHESCEAWILGSLCLIHSGCTMGIQAKFLGKTSLDVSNLIANKCEPAVSTLMADCIPNSVKEIQDVINTCIKLRAKENEEKKIADNIPSLTMNQIISNNIIASVNSHLPSNLQIGHQSMTGKICEDSLNFFSTSEPRQNHSTESIINMLDNKSPNYGKSKHQSPNDIVKKLFILNKLVEGEGLNGKITIQSTRSTNVFMMFKK